MDIDYVQNSLLLLLRSDAHVVASNTKKLPLPFIFSFVMDVENKATEYDDKTMDRERDRDFERDRDYDRERDRDRERNGERGGRRDRSRERGGMSLLCS